MRKVFSISLPLIVLVMLSSPVLAQEKVLTVDDYDRWSRIVGAEISNNGDWMAYGLRPNGADDTLHVVSLRNDTRYTIPLGENAVFSDNSEWVAYTITVDEETRKALEEKGDPIFESAQLMNLDTGEKYTVERSAAMTFSENGRFWAVHRKKPESDKSKHKGTDLIVRDLQDGTMINMGNVSEFAFNKKSTMLAYLVDASEKAGNGIYLKNLESGALSTLDSDTSVYAGLTWDDKDTPRNEWAAKGAALAVLKGQIADSLMHTQNELIVIQDLNSSSEKSVLNPANQRNFPDEMVISENRDLSWSSNGEMVFIGIRLQEPKLKMDRDTIPNVDVFHWKDDRIQTVQERQAARDRRFTYVASFNPVKLIHLSGLPMKRCRR
jgi:hypothetical protein